MIPFVKAHACGNDFLIVDQPLPAADYADIARAMCARNTGVGADGVEYLSLSGNGEYVIRLFNADGSEAEISGNGTRCVAAHLAQQEDGDSISIRTHAGTRRCHIVARDFPRYRIATEMGLPSLEPKTVILKDGSPIAGYHVSMGNPHFVLFVDTEDFRHHGRPWQQLGAELCIHRSFPHGTNVEFVRILDPHTIAFRIYERGVGPTQSSGTGTSASAAAGIKFRETARSLTVLAEGGEQTVDWPADSEQLLLTGPAEIIAQGEFLLR